MRQRAIAEKLDVSPSLVSQVKLQHKFTYNIELAKYVSQITGKRPIDHMPKHIHRQYLKNFPELGKIIKRKNG